MAHVVHGYMFKYVDKYDRYCYIFVDDTDKASARAQAARLMSRGSYNLELFEEQDTPWKKGGDN